MKLKLKIHKSRQGFLSALADGIRAPFDALAYIAKHKGLVLYVVIPFFLNILLLGLLSYLCFVYLHPRLLTLLPSGSQWYFVAVTLVGRSLLTLLTVLAIIFLYSVCGTIIHGPFLEALSEKVEEQIVGKKSGAAFSIVKVFTDTWRTCMSLLKSLLFVITINLILFALNFIPVAGSLLFTIFSFISFLFFFGLPYFEPALDRLNAGFDAKMKAVFSYKWTIIGSGLGFLLVSLIPVLGFLAHPLGMIGGAIIYSEKMYPDFELIERS